MSYYPGSSRRNSSFASRPTSLYGPSSSLSFIGNSGISQSSPYLNGSSYSPSSSYTTYGGTSSGYGSLLVPSSSTLPTTSSSLYNSLLQGLSSRSSSPAFSNRSSYSPTGYGSPTSSRYPSRSSSFNRHGPYKSSKSGSTTSLANSEGYESGTEKSGKSSRLDVSSTEDSKVQKLSPENGEIDYKKLYEESLLENDRLREKLRHTEEDLALARTQAEKNAILHKNSLSEGEKRERRAMERKLSEMEEELKQLQKLKADNERLRAENRALTRVVSNLTASQNKRN